MFCQGVFLVFDNFVVFYIISTSIACSVYLLYVFLRFLVRRIAPQYACKYCVKGVPLISIDGKIFSPRYCPWCGRRL